MTKSEAHYARAAECTEKATALEAKIETMRHMVLLHKEEAREQARLGNEAARQGK